MWKCKDCGAVTDNPDIRVEHGGCGYTEEFYVCESCRGECEEAAECSICHDYDFKDSMICGVCKECYKDLITLDNVLYFAEEMDDDEMYYFLTEDIFTKDEVIDILKKKIKDIPEEKLKQLLIKYVNKNDDYFVEQILKKNNKKEG